MGGCGSGRSPQKFSVEDCYTFRLPWLLQNGYLDGHKTYGGCSWGNPLRPSYSLNFNVVREGEGALRFDLITTGQQVAARATPLHFGGLRWWFDCPGCQRRCTKLYLPPRSSHFLCRICHGLTYQSRRMNKYVSLSGRRFET